MVEITAKINGMACGMCETHINDAVRNNFKVKKVSSSHSKAQTVIVAEEDIPDDKLKEVVEKAGYVFAGADRKHAESFRTRLEQRGIPATVRRELGSDIDAACGQLRNKK